MNSTNTRKLVYEINTRCWLRELSDAFGAPVTLGSVPAAQFDRWAKLGFSHIWAMGVWKTGPRSQALARSQPSLRQLCAEFFPDWVEDDIDSSPYAIADYSVAESLGGEAGLREFRNQLRDRGMGLLLDFVPNHVGIDHSWLISRPDFFVQCSGGAPGVFPIRTVDGLRWIAHGKDPYFPPWNDTAQLDYRNPETRAAMIDTLKFVAARCDGVRCDMAMLLLNEVFQQTWARFPFARHLPSSEFWPDAIQAVNAERPDFLFLAEAYWNLEPKLHQLGFDYAYDKPFYDYLTRREFPELRRQLNGVAFPPARFLENHDEPRIASILTADEQQAAALLLMSQPGLRLLYDGQLTGRTRKTPVQLTRYLSEPHNPKVTDFYERLLLAFAEENKTRPQVESPRQIQSTQTALEPATTFVNYWPLETGRLRLSAVNMESRSVEIRAEIPNLRHGSWTARDLLDNGQTPPSLNSGLLEITLPPRAGRLLEFCQTKS